MCCRWWLSRNVLGVPPEKYATFKEWSDRVIEGGILVFRFRRSGTGTDRSDRVALRLISARKLRSVATNRAPIS